MNDFNMSFEVQTLSPEEQCRRFVELVNPDGPRCFRILSPKSSGEKGLAFNEVFAPRQWQINQNGSTVYDSLNAWNERGRAVYMTVNKVDKGFAKDNGWKGVSNDNITAVNALFLDFDNPEAISLDDIKSMEVVPSIVVETSPGKFHCYWLLKSNDEIATGEFKQVQTALQAKFNALKPDKKVKDLPRIMRVPGFIHSPKLNANDGRFMSRLVWANDTRYSSEEILDFIGDAINEPDTSATKELSESADDDFDAALKYQGESGEKLLDNIESATRFLIEEAGYCATNDTFEELAAVFSHFQGTSNEAESEELFEKLCASAPGYTGHDELDRMKSFAQSYSGAKITEKSLFKRATNAGWINPEKNHSPGFKIKEDGVYEVIKKGEDVLEVWVSDVCTVLAWTRSNANTNAGFVLRYTPIWGGQVDKAYPRAMLHNSRELAEQLDHDGLRIQPGKHLSVARYISNFKTDRLAYCVSNTGWCNECFVLPEKTLTPETSDTLVVFQASASLVNVKQSGTIDSWREDLSALCRGNPVLMFSVSCAFAGPLLEPLNMDGGGIHLVGPSSKGKSTALRMAASVYGEPIPGGFWQSWRQTDNSLESVLQQHSGLFLPLDDMKQVASGNALAQAIMMAGNNQGKGRANRNGDSRSPKTFRTLILSTGEKTPQNILAAERVQADAGVEVRMPSIDVVSDKGMIQNLHHTSNQRELVDEINTRAKSQYGAVGLEWLTRLVNERDDSVAKVKVFINEFHEKAKKAFGDIGSQQQRVLERFALVAAAGELASDYGLTGWDCGEATEAVLQLSGLYLEQRGKTEDSERVKILKKLRENLSAKSSKFPSPYRSPYSSGEWVADRVNDKLGYKMPKVEPAWVKIADTDFAEDEKHDWEDEQNGLLYLIPTQGQLVQLVDGDFDVRQITDALESVEALSITFEKRKGMPVKNRMKKIVPTKYRQFDGATRFYVIDRAKLGDDSE